MHLDTSTPSSPLLELTLGEAFKLQDQLNDLIRRMTMDLSSGMQTCRDGTGQELYVGTTSAVVQTIVPGFKDAFFGSLTIMLVKPLK